MDEHDRRQVLKACHALEEASTCPRKTLGVSQSAKNAANEVFVAERQN